jgi:hypothetical protein
MPASAVAAQVEDQPAQRHPLTQFGDRGLFSFTAATIAMRP